MRNTKKMIKERFRKEVGDDYKLFTFTGLKYDLYPQMETLKLSRFISIIKIKPVEWRKAHPFIMADRWENLEDENKEGE
jgi:ribosome biogenesis protein BMS1